MTRYSVGFLLALGMILIVAILIIRGLGSGPKPKVIDLNSYASSDVSVRFTIDTPVSATSTHKDIVIDVNNSTATLTVTQGYQGQQVRTKSYQTDVSAYAVFLHALTLNGFTQGDSAASASDERGQCALGDRYIYEVVDGSGNDMQRYWHTSCNTGTFNGSARTIQELFINQIPEYGQLTNDVNL